MLYSFTHSFIHSFILSIYSRYPVSSPVAALDALSVGTPVVTLPLAQREAFRSAAGFWNVLLHQCAEPPRYRTPGKKGADGPNASNGDSDGGGNGGDWMLRAVGGGLAPIDQQFYPPVVADSYDMAAAAMAVATRPLLAARLRRLAVTCRGALFKDGRTAADLARFLYTAARGQQKQREVEGSRERKVLQEHALREKRRKASYHHAPPLYVHPATAAAGTAA